MIIKKMWKVVSKKTGDAFFMTSEKDKYTVGRQTCDLNLKNDTSISRTHACFIPSTDYVDVIDMGSKYNTYCNENIENNIPLKKNIPFKLKDGERVKFGAFENEFILTKMKIVTASSTLNSTERQQLTEIMSKIKGHVVDSITSECTHLTMNTITITTKLVEALLEGIPIVTIDFWVNYWKALREGKTLPDPINYLPNVSESFLNVPKENFTFKEERKTLFSEKTFVFPKKTTYETYAPIIAKAGGHSKTLHHKISLDSLSKQNIIVVQNTTSTQSQESNQTIDKISEFLKKKSLRLIPEYEIGLALAISSTQKYCNTQFNMEDELLKQNDKKESSELNKLDVIAEETPNLDEKNKKVRNNLSDIEVPESIASAVYDLTESDVEESEVISSENIAQNSQENLLEVIIVKESKNSKNEQLNEEIFLNKPNLESENKRKRENSPNNQTTNQNNKKLHLGIENIPESVDENMVSKSKPKLPSGFLDKSLIRKEGGNSKSQSDVSKHNESQNINNQKKRRRFATLDSGDENEGEDLFDFGRSQNKRNRIIANSSEEDNHNSDDEDGLFNIRKKNKSKSLTTSSQRNISTPKDTANEEIQTIKSSSSNSSKQSYTREWKKSSVPSEPISTVGWLSKNMIKIKIKDEVDSTINTTKCTTNSIKSEADSNWINSLKGAFQVRVKPMSLISKCSDVSNVLESANSGNDLLNTTTLKNFKAFVKKRNFKTQKEVLSTVPYHVTGFSF